jgi:hypothetical protein
MDRYRVTKIRQTSELCPSQWEGRLEDGRHIYIRYKWGLLEVGIGETFNAAVADRSGQIPGRQLGDRLDGYLTYEALRAAAPMLELP